MLPNFLIVGAARSGTTTLYSRLQAHPDVYLPASKRPEPHFFLKNAEYARGLGYYEERFFSGWRGQKAVGEASTSYLFSQYVPGRIRADLPEIRSIALLRNPIERAFSNYWHTVKGGLETMTFRDALAAEAQRAADLAGTPMGEVAPFAYVERGFYGRQLERWLEVFDRSQMKIVIFEDFTSDPEGVLEQIAQFLEIDPVLLPHAPLEKENESVPNGAQTPPETFDALAEIFRSDVVKLGRILERDLTHWLERRRS